jgi:ubiquinone/menaquinone biosynthesis C-methylase UbiE
MTTNDADQLRSVVREHYGQAARAAGSPASNSSCCSEADAGPDPFGRSAYDAGDQELLPEAALVASLGCGNPTVRAELSPGEVVLDLGSGGGIDVLLSARRVAPDGMAYGLDMTPDMHQLAQRNQADSGVTNAEFLLGTIEDIPLPDSTVDVIISNCVVNLAADKSAVFAEAFRVLRPGGRLAISDIVLSRPLPPHLSAIMGLWTGCIAGALPEAVCRDELSAAGFQEVVIERSNVLRRTDLESMASQLDPALIPADIDVASTIDELDGVVISAFIRARKPA